jgi:cytochrome P450
LLSILGRAELDGQRLTDDEIFAFCCLLLPAGAETTYRSSSNLLCGLLTHPDQLAAVRADRDLLPRAIEEGIRWEPPLTGIIRFSLRDVEVEGFSIPKGAVVNLSLASANRDETKFEHPDEFDVFRSTRQHVSFALGPHTCLGMHLARMETAVALTTLLDRLPGLRLDADADDVQIAGVAFRSPRSLPVVFDAG